MISMSFPFPTPDLTTFAFGTAILTSSPPLAASSPSERHTRQYSPPPVRPNDDDVSYPSEIMDPHVLQTQAVE